MKRLRLPPPLLLLLILPLFAAAAPPPAVMLNAPPVNDWATGRPVVNLALLSRAPGSVAKPYDMSIPQAAYNAFGWPTVDFGSCVVLHDYPSGVYAYGSAGAGRVTFTAGIVPGSQTATTVRIDGESGYLEYKVTGVSAADPFRDFRIVTPGYAPDAYFTREYLAQFEVCGVIRTMDLQKTNVVRHPVTWQGRAPPGGPQTLDATGVSVEFLIRLANDTGKDLWICLPHSASPDTRRSMAVDLAAGLKPGIKVYLEEGNELWNGRFPQRAATIALAKADPTLTSADENARQYQWAIARLRRDVGIFRAELGAERVWGTLPGQGVVPWRIEEGLVFGVQQFGRVDDFLRFIAYNAYFAPTFKVETTAGGPTLDQLFASARAEVEDVGAWMGDEHAKLAARFNVGVAAYEGGQHVCDEMWDDQGVRFYGNHDLHEQFQRDPRVGELTRRNVELAGQKGMKLFGYFNGVNGWGDKKDANRGRNGYFGGRESIDDHTPKWDALIALAAQNIPQTPPIIPPTPPVIAPPPPTTAPATKPTTAPTTAPATRPTTLPAVITTVTIETPIGTVTISPGPSARVSVK